MLPIVLSILGVLLLLILVLNIKFVPQSKAYVIERLGAFHAVWGVGPHFKVPFFERVAKAVSLKEQVVDFAPQPVITKDNVTMQIDTVIYFQITDPKLYTYGVEHPMSAIENLTATTLRNIIGELELDQTLTSRDIINTKMRTLLDEATDPWGIKVNRVELKNIIPPREIQDAMEKQMKAERERRESILQAEGQKQSQILVAEGEKQSAILRADAAKQAAILEAEGKAEAILKVQQALADSIEMLNRANPNDQVVKIKALEAFQAAADGRATKIDHPQRDPGPGRSVRQRQGHLRLHGAERLRQEISAAPIAEDGRPTGLPSFFVPIVYFSFSGDSPSSWGRTSTRISMTRRWSTRVTVTSRPSAWKRSPSSGTRPICSMTQPETVLASHSPRMEKRSKRSVRSALQEMR